ncbi:MAG: aldehyde dehydrogenase family protein [Arenicella sp.]
MLDRRQFYIDGEWVNPALTKPFDVINPATETPVAVISLGAKNDLNKAVSAAKRAFNSWGTSSISDRETLLRNILKSYERRKEEMAQMISLELGCPISFSREEQVPCGSSHLEATLEALLSHEFERPSLRGGSMLHDEPVGVCGLITPWNWPIHQLAAKVVPAIAAGCTMVLKPSELSPLSAALFAEILDEAGCPPGVFNLINGDGAEVGSALTAHPDIDLISFTGSTRAGVLVTQSAAESVKRVVTELGGKSPNICFADADLESAVSFSVASCFSNSGQSCDAPTRLLVERSVYSTVIELATRQAQHTKVAPPSEEGDHIGPVISQTQYDKIQQLIQTGIDEGARLIAGGTGKPEGIDTGYYVRPTIFADVSNDMNIAQQEIFGPVLVIIPFDDEDEAIQIANDTPYGLYAYIQTGNPDRAMRVARQIRAGNVSVNGQIADFDVPFGGYKQSGNGREYGLFGLHDFLETKGITLN